MTRSGALPCLFHRSRSRPPSSSRPRFWQSQRLPPSFDLQATASKQPCSRPPLPVRYHPCTLPTLTPHPTHISCTLPRPAGSGWRHANPQLVLCRRRPSRTDTTDSQLPPQNCVSMGVAKQGPLVVIRALGALPESGEYDGLWESAYAPGFSLSRRNLNNATGSWSGRTPPWSNS